MGPVIGLRTVVTLNALPTDVVVASMKTDVSEGALDPDAAETTALVALQRLIWMVLGWVRSSIDIGIRKQCADCSAFCHLDRGVGCARYGTRELA